MGGGGATPACIAGGIPACLAAGGAIPACIAGGIPPCLAAGGCYPSMHCRWYPTMPCSRGVLLRGGSALGGSAPGGFLLLWGSAPGGVAFCYGLLLWPSGLVPSVEGDLLVWSPGGGGRRPAHQKATTEKGVPGGDPPRWLLLRAVCILLECILVKPERRIKFIVNVTQTVNNTELW